METLAEERRLVSVLFCDLVGFTARSDHADPEDVKAQLRPFHARIKRAVETHGGRLDKFLGDGALGVFGMPAMHEDDPERSLRAAFAIQEAIAELNRERPGEELPARIGLASGEAVVSLGMGPQIGESVTGDVVNTASRIQSAASPGGILVDEATYLATRELFEYSGVEHVALKGKSVPVPVWQPIRPVARVRFDLPPDLPTPMIGRTDEAATLGAVFHRAMSEQTTEIVVVVGAPGIGKSRLALELSRRAEEMPELVRWRQGRALPYGEGMTFAPIADVVMAECGILGTDGPDEASEKLDRVLARLIASPTERRWLRPPLAALVGLPDEGRGPAERKERFVAWSRFLEAMAKEGPFVLVLEDMHAATDAMLDFLQDIAADLPDLPFLLIILGRPELIERSPALTSGPRVSTIELDALTTASTRQLVDALLTGRDVPDETQSELIDRSAGIPLYAVEFARMLRDSPPVADSDAYPRAAVPPSLGALLGSRIDALPPEARSVVLDASVIGTTFWPGALAAMSGPTRSVSDTLDLLVTREVIHEVRASSLEGEREYVFWHGTLRDVAYSRIPRAAKIDRHRAAAGWLEEIAKSRLSDLAEQIAGHYLAALDLATAAEEVGIRKELIEPATRFLVMAGENARGFDVESASVLFSRALEIAPEGHELRAEALMGAGITASLTGRLEEAQRLLSDAVEAWAHLGDDVRRAETMTSLARSLSWAGALQEVEPLLTAAIDLLAPGGPSPELAITEARYAGHLWILARRTECIEWANRALTMAQELGAERTGVLALGYLGAARSNLGDAEGLQDLRRAVDWGRELGIAEETAIAYNNLADGTSYQEGPRAALAAWEEMIDFCDERGLDTSLAWARMGALDSMFDLGQWDRLLGEARGLIGWAESRGGTTVEVGATILAAWVAVRRGEIAEAQSLEARIKPLIDDIGVAEYAVPALAISAELSRLSGDREGVVAQVRDVSRLAESDPVIRSIYTPLVVRLFTWAGALGEADEAIRSATSAVSTRERLSLLTARATLAEARVELDDARRLFHEAVQGWNAYGFVLEEAICLLGLGHVLRLLGERKAATDALRSSRVLLDPLGAAPLLHEIDREVIRLDPSR